MNRKEYIKTQLFSVLALVIAACKKRIIEVTPKPVLKKVLQIKSVLPEVAVASELLKIHWESENIAKINIYSKLNQDNWKLEGASIQAALSYYEINMPNVFAENDMISIKIEGDTLESIKTDIKTLFIPPNKSIKIIKTEPGKAIADGKLDVYYESENIPNINIELKNQSNTILGSVNVNTPSGFYSFSMPKTFNRYDVLTITISGDGVIETKKDIPTFNLLLIDTKDYNEIKTINGIDKANFSFSVVYLKRVSMNEIKAFSAACTHAGCGIDYIKNDDVFNCPCHGAKFSTDGKVLNGPANAPLNEYVCEWVSTEIFRLLY